MVFEAPLSDIRTILGVFPSTIICSLVYVPDFTIIVSPSLTCLIACVMVAKGLP